MPKGAHKVYDNLPVLLPNTASLKFHVYLTTQKKIKTTLSISNNALPKQVIGTGTSQSGHGNAFFSNCAEVFSHGIEPFCACIFTSTAEWQGAGHLCPHFAWILLQTCLHAGQSPKWHLCGSRFSWWQSGGKLKTNKRIRYVRQLFFFFVDIRA